MYSFIVIGTFIPRKEVEVTETIRATVIQPNQAIRLRARKETRVKMWNLILNSRKEFYTYIYLFFNMYIYICLCNIYFKMLFQQFSGSWWVFASYRRGVASEESWCISARSIWRSCWYCWCLCTYRKGKFHQTDVCIFIYCKCMYCVSRGKFAAYNYSF